MKKHSPKKPITVLKVEMKDTLLSYLLQALPKLTRNNVKSLLVHHQVSVDGQLVTKYDYPLNIGQEVRINWEIVRNTASIRQMIRILYEDKDILVVDKPAGMLSIASDKEKEKTAYHILTDYVREQDPKNRLFIVHRLDRDTSGVMMFARNEYTKYDMQDNWKERVKDRAYLALVEGKVEKKQGQVHSWLKETSTHLVYSCKKQQGAQEAITNYRCLETAFGFSLLEIRLETGRKNQIRVHMKDIGHSIVGDKRYGAETNPLGRLGLHAHILQFEHPVTKDTLTFETEIPQGFKKMLKNSYRRDGRWIR